MFSLRTLVMAAATLLIAGCASDGYGGGYGDGYDGGYYSNDGGYYPGGTTYYPGGTYYGYNPSYTPYGYGGYAYGYDDNDNDNGHRRFFRPEHGVTCDRARHICWDNDGPSYRETKQYFGKHDANEAFNRDGDQGRFDNGFGNGGVLFSPQRGVTCDRSRGICYDRHGIDDDLTNRYFGRHHSNFVGDTSRQLNNNGKFNNVTGQDGNPNTNNPNNMWWLNR